MREVTATGSGSDAEEVSRGKKPAGRVGRVISESLLTPHGFEVHVRPTSAPVRISRTKIPFKLHRLGGPADPVIDLLPHERRKVAPAQLRRGDWAWIALDDDVPAGWIWLSPRPSRNSWTGVHFWMRPGEASMYDWWAVPEYRSAGVAAFVMGSMLDDVARNNPEVHSIYGCAELDNRPSLVMCHVMFGFKAVQTVHTFEIRNRFGWQVPLRTRPYAAGPVSIAWRLPEAWRKRLGAKK